jgi:BirA family biotin operon repressor/biotin-[acetyl-CoA-carboxylase] ligase
MQKRLHEWEHEIWQCCPELGVVQCYDEIGSTMDAAPQLSPHLALEQFGVLVARSQLSGRGQHGSTWSEGSRGLYATWICRTALAPARLIGLSLVVGLAVKHVCAEFGAEVRLKWPNDVYSVAGAKLAGILIESSVWEGATQVGIGVGLNIEHAPVTEQLTTDLLALTQRKISAPQVAGLLSSALMRYWSRFQQGGFSAFREEWTQSAFGLGRGVRLHTANAVQQGEFIGISEDGCLRVLIENREHLFASGHLRFL